MKYIFFLLLISFNLFSQEIIVPVESKSEYLYNNSNYKNYTFKDLNNVFGKFLGKWKHKTENYEITIEIIKFFDDNNKQDAIYLNIKYIKGNLIIIDTSNFKTPNYICGGIFNNKNDINNVSVFFSEISEKPTCGNVSKVKLSIEDTNTLIWKIEIRELLFNKTAKLLPNNIKFIKQ